MRTKSRRCCGARSGLCRPSPSRSIRPARSARWCPARCSRPGRRCQTPAWRGSPGSRSDNGGGVCRARRGCRCRWRASGWPTCACTWTGACGARSRGGHFKGCRLSGCGWPRGDTGSWRAYGSSAGRALPRSAWRGRCGCACRKGRGHARRGKSLARPSAGPCRRGPDRDRSAVLGRARRAEPTKAVRSLAAPPRTHTVRVGSRQRLLRWKRASRSLLLRRSPWTTSRSTGSDSCFSARSCLGAPVRRSARCWDGQLGAVIAPPGMTWRALARIEAIAIAPGMGGRLRNGRRAPTPANPSGFRSARLTGPSRRGRRRSTMGGQRRRQRGYR